MDERFTHLVVPLDLESCGDRSIDVARDLAALGNLPVELVTVLPASFDIESGQHNLTERAGAHGLEHSTPIVLQGNDPALSIVAHVSSLEAPLVVLGTAAHGPVGELLTASASARLMSLVTAPVVVVGPHVADGSLPLPPTLIACIGPSTETDPTLPVMARWAGTFGGPEPWFVEVLPPNGLRDVADDVRETSLVQRRAERLADLGVRSEWDVLHGRDLVEAVERFAEQIDEPVLVVESEHWTDPDHVHLHSVARRLAHRARQPVLVVPHVGHRQPASLHAGR